MAAHWTALNLTAPINPLQQFGVLGESAALEDVAREVAIGASMLERWRSEELSRPGLLRR